MSYRLARWPEDTDTITNAVHTLHSNYAAYGYSRAPSPKKVLDYIDSHQQDGNAYIVGECYLLLVGCGTAWHGEDTALEERLVLCLTTGRLSSVPCALEAIARERGVSAVLANDSSIGFRMGAVYQRAGFKPITTTYYKEISWDNGSLS